MSGKPTEEEFVEFLALLRRTSPTDHPFVRDPDLEPIVVPFVAVAHALADLFEAEHKLDPVDGQAMARDLVEAIVSYLPARTSAEDRLADTLEAALRTPNSVEVPPFESGVYLVGDINPATYGTTH